MPQLSAPAAPVDDFDLSTLLRTPALPLDNETRWNYSDVSSILVAQRDWWWVVDVSGARSACRFPGNVEFSRGDAVEHVGGGFGRIVELGECAATGLMMARLQVYLPQHAGVQRQLISTHTLRCMPVTFLKRKISILGVEASLQCGEFVCASTLDGGGQLSKDEHALELLLATEEVCNDAPGSTLAAQLECALGDMAFGTRDPAAERTFKRNTLLSYNAEVAHHAALVHLHELEVVMNALTLFASGRESVQALVLHLTQGFCAPPLVLPILHRDALYFLLATMISSPEVAAFREREHAARVITYQQARAAPLAAAPSVPITSSSTSDSATAVPVAVRAPAAAVERTGMCHECGGARAWHQLIRPTNARHVDAHASDANDTSKIACYHFFCKSCLKKKYIVDWSNVMWRIVSWPCPVCCTTTMMTRATATSTPTPTSTSIATPATASAAISTNATVAATATSHDASADFAAAAPISTTPTSAVSYLVPCWLQQRHAPTMDSHALLTLLCKMPKATLAFGLRALAESTLAVAQAPPSGDFGAVSIDAEHLPCSGTDVDLVELVPSLRRPPPGYRPRVIFVPIDEASMAPADEDGVEYGNGSGAADAHMRICEVLRLLSLNEALAGVLEARVEIGTSTGAHLPTLRSVFSHAASYGFASIDAFVECTRRSLHSLYSLQRTDFALDQDAGGSSSSSSAWSSAASNCSLGTSAPQHVAAATIISRHFEQLVAQVLYR